jgi:hypothetical protein
MRISQMSAAVQYFLKNFVELERILGFVISFLKPAFACWPIFLPLTAVALVLLLIVFCCIRRCCRKRRPKDAKKGAKGAVDLKSVQLLGNAYKEKVTTVIK